MKGDRFYQNVKRQTCTQELRALLPIFMCSNNPPTSEKMSDIDKEAVLSRLVVIHADELKTHFKPLRFIKSLETAHEPLTLEQVSSFPYSHSFLYFSQPFIFPHYQSLHLY